MEEEERDEFLWRRLKPRDLSRLISLCHPVQTPNSMILIHLPRRLRSEECRETKTCAMTQGLLTFNEFSSATWPTLGVGHCGISATSHPCLVTTHPLFAKEIFARYCSAIKISKQCWFKAIVHPKRHIFFPRSQRFWRLNRWRKDLQPAANTVFPLWYDVM